MANASNTADEILACARTLVVAGGFNGFSYADIAETVGIRKPSIHHHFPTKADLVRVMVARHREQTEAGLARLAANVPDPVDQLGFYTGRWKQCISDGSIPFCVCALLACELPVLPPEVAAEVRAYFRLLSGWLTSVLERGEIEGRFALTSTPAIEAETFMSTVHGAMLSARAYGNPEMFGLITDPLIARLTVRQPAAA